MIRDPIVAAVGTIAVALALSSCAAQAGASGPNLAAAEKAVQAQMGKDGRPFFSAVYTTRTAVCGVVSTGVGGGGDDNDARFLVEFAPDAKGRLAPSLVLIDRARTTAESSAFVARWIADCDAT